MVYICDEKDIITCSIIFLSLGATEKTGAYFGSGSGPIHLDYVVCSGTEYNLTECQTGNETRQSRHSEDVGVKCQTSNYKENLVVPGLYYVQCDSESTGPWV